MQTHTGCTYVQAMLMQAHITHESALHTHTHMCTNVAL